MSFNQSFHFLELCAGISSFHVASQSIKNMDFHCIGASEIDDFCNTYLDEQGINIIGDVKYLALPENEHPYSEICQNEDIPACELNNDISSITMNDLLEGVVEFPRALISGFPCQSLSSANTSESRGINGPKSDLFHVLMEKVELLMPELVILENSSNFTFGGLELAVQQLTDLGYKVEWDVASCTAFGYPYYRHRCFVIGYNISSPLFHTPTNVLDVVAQKFATKQPGDVFPLMEHHTPDLIDQICTLETKGNFRRHRVAALGNSINVDQAKAILQSIADLYTEPSLHSDTVNTRNIPCRLDELEVHKKSGFKKFPSRGYAYKDQVFYGERDLNLNPPLNQFKHLSMMASLIRNDHKNNFSTSSRLNRPGSLGGLVGFFMKELGFDEGAINPPYCEAFMGFPRNSTKVESKLIRNKLLP
ncbi:DNA cytosine methyltransferase [Vibrio parahaemolyticus]|uniref:DNA cytosine methyltransferase n=1 Tax=Vibrio parahaemolyticus TaxID=670 RepID=UPI001A902867|nr:DNA cytosine methyltransferase [Vibrio parahaemolyticus]MBO0179755.1 DNA cytosine methyltransferase [Vibrio parahaemolyticus]MDF5359974.1 DNA cytosine methyltransferase [Vibrio parahaemolyticus]MDG2754337.1 DNA cytosine methyltransferase [Vibrio parahaemolyticus]MDG2763790.1 DNA cytosine methyltransferase [Vibrio parahaemolyticus]WKV20312.1 Modification methylase BanI [Vibrio parahaemolyticus]